MKVVNLFFCRLGVYRHAVSVPRKSGIEKCALQEVANGKC